MAGLNDLLGFITGANGDAPSYDASYYGSSEPSASFVDPAIQAFSRQSPEPEIDWQSILGMSDAPNARQSSIADSSWYAPQGGVQEQLGSVWDWLTKTNMKTEPVYDQQGKVVGQRQVGISPLGAGIGGLTALDEYMRNRKLSKTAQQQFQAVQSNNQADRARALQKQATSDALGGAFDVSVDPRKYLGIDPLQAARYGKLNKATGSVYAPVMYDKSLPTVTVTPRAASATANPLNLASGGSVSGALGMLRGGTSGQSDKVPANVSHGEYVMDADVVSALGDGNSEAGAAKLDEMRQAVRKHKRSAPKTEIPPKAKSPLEYMKKGGK